MLSVHKQTNNRNTNLKTNNIKNDSLMYLERAMDNSSPERTTNAALAHVFAVGSKHKQINININIII